MSQQPFIRPILPADTHALRHAVLWPDKPISYVQLAEDEDGQHFGAFIEDELVSVISMFIDDAGEARFRKFATATSWQGKGIGSKLLDYTIAAAAKTGTASIWCDARTSALPFYLRFGMEVEGEVFHKGGVPYLKLSRTLP
ncbi:N-acetyltransferase GCN5 [Pseudomassariella vexata]|uniref:N-acetyltransferase GCN5 n=1 Tax=Pseudomassariella vexata TaxID=1141098 RepID=A0A1Y2DHU8_9PEZI|nr:N-acetyltransferase GCN5 [Pseudomassariella vexata]ORY58706.1 N-acetyltransferase GCN5 [Pseudomassariella vexata]